MDNFQLYRNFFDDIPLGKTALSYINEFVFADILEQIDTASYRLKCEGITQGDIVAIQLSNSFTLIYLIFATWKCNASVLLLEPLLSDRETEHRLSISGANHIIYETKMSGLVFSGFSETVDYSINSLSPNNKTAFPGSALLFCTSGTTGHPKVIIRTGNSIWNEMVRHISNRGALSSEDTVLLLSPMFHSYGLLSGLLNSFHVHASCVFSNNKTSSIISTLQEKNVSAIFGVPFHYNLLLTNTKHSDLKHLRIAVSAGEQLDSSTYNLFQAQYGIRIGQLYGMSELGMVSVDYTGDYPGSVGRVADDIILKLRNGQIEVYLPRSPYMNDDAQRFSDGWLITKDRGELVDQLLYIRGRTDSLIIRAGKKVDLVEIENIVKTYKCIRNSIVVSENEKILCYLSVEEGFNIEEFTRWLQCEVSGYKLPNCVYVVEKFNITSTNKNIRRNLNQLKVLQQYRFI